MSRPRAVASLAERIAQLGMGRVNILNSSYNTMVQVEMPSRNASREMILEEKCNDRPQLQLQNNNQTMTQYSGQDTEGLIKHFAGENISRKDKLSFLINTLLNLKDDKEAVYGALDAWVAWEQNFPISAIKRALLALEKEQQWHRIIQVIKWMLSKGQGTTMGTYGQLIKALDMDHRAEEAHCIWVKKIGIDLHPVPWQLCKLMISIYYRNDMLENLIKLFKGLEAFDRKPPEKSIVQKVSNAYEMLGLSEEKNRVLEKYNDLFTKTRENAKKTRKDLSKKKKKPGQSNYASTKHAAASAIQPS